MKLSLPFFMKLSLPFLLLGKHFLGRQYQRQTRFESGAVGDAADFDVSLAGIRHDLEYLGGDLAFGQY